MKKHLSLFCFVFVFSIVVAQDSFDTNRFLLGAKQEESVVFQYNKMQFLSNLPHDLRHIEKMEIRTETNEFDFSKQEYLFRVSPNSLRNIKTHKQYYQTVQYMAEMEMEGAIGEAFRIRYDLLIDHIYLEELKVIKEAIQKVIKDKVTYLNRSISLPGFDVLDLIEAQDESQSNIRDILNLENEKLTNTQNIERLQGVYKKLNINKENLVTIDNVKQVLKDRHLKTASSHPLLKAQSAKLYNTMLEYEWEMAKNKFSIGYVQAKYSYDSNDNFRKSFSIGIGFEIPLRRAAQLDINGLLIQKLESESQYRTIKNKMEEEEYTLYRQLQNRLKQYDLVETQLSEGQAEFVLEEYAKNAEASPMVLLKLREITLKNQLLLKELEFDIIHIYIDYLDITGLLYQKPLKNYLTKNLSGLSH